MFPTTLAFLLLSGTGPADIPKDTMVNRFVPPGQEHVITPALFKYKVSLSEVNEIENPLERDKDFSRSSYVTDPDDASKLRILMFYGIKNAKEMALRRVVSQSRNKKTPSDVSFSCVPYYPTGLRAAFLSKTQKKIQSGDWWYSCKAVDLDQ